MRRDTDRVPSLFLDASSLAPPARPAMPTPALLTIVPLAQAAPPAGGGLFGNPLLLIAVMFGIMYFFMIRPQSKREKVRRAMIDAVQKGDRIITAGGVHGTVTKVDETSVLVSVDGDTKLRFEKSAIASVMTKDGAKEKAEAA